MNNIRKFIVANKISAIFIPPFVLALVFLLVIFFTSGLLLYKIIWWLIVFFVALFSPAYFTIMLYRQGKVRDKYLFYRRERTLPYLFSISCIILSIGLLHLTYAPKTILAYMICYLFNSLILLIINLRWKMSAHMVGLTTALVFLSWEFGILTIPFYLLIPIIGWARLQLGAHTRSQVIVGTLFGFILTTVQLFVLLP